MQKDTAKLKLWNGIYITYINIASKYYDNEYSGLTSNFIAYSFTLKLSAHLFQVNRALLMYCIQ